MRILIQPPNYSEGGQAELGREIGRAIELLRRAYIPTDGSGTVGYNGDMFAALILRRGQDGTRAVHALKKAGIRASIQLPPAKSPVIRAR
jgi:hypothetical protein